MKNNVAADTNDTDASYSAILVVYGAIVTWATAKKIEINDGANIRLFRQGFEKGRGGIDLCNAFKESFRLCF